MSANLSCPRDGAPLALFQLSRGCIGRCDRCAGTWLDNLACQRLVGRDFPDAAHEIIRPPSIEAAREGGYRENATPADAETRIHCPQCSAALTPFASDPAQVGVRVALDVCSVHGTWFDAGEAWSLLQSLALRHGALDNALAMDADDRADAARGSAVLSVVSSGARTTFRF